MGEVSAQKPLNRLFGWFFLCRGFFTAKFLQFSGFARRITFEADEGRLNSNDNYFYSDNRPEGYAFELELLSPGDKFTIFDMNHQAQGTVEVLNIEVGHQGVPG